jgi:hypothetical protein
MPNARIEESLAILEAKTHQTRMQLAKSQQDDRATGGSYNKQVKKYERWWKADQALRCAEDSKWMAVPPFPVTPTKVALFLEYETTREKVSISFCPLVPPAPPPI